MFEIDNFYLIVLSIAIIVLIIALGFMGWMLSHQKDQIKFPSITTTCPDYWSVSEDGLYCEQPVSTHFNYGKDANVLTTGYVKIGTTNAAGIVPGKRTTSVVGKHTANSFDSKDAGWGSGKEATCNKRKWSNDNNIKWDTVTNVNFC